MTIADVSTVMSDDDRGQHDEKDQTDGESLGSLCQDARID